MEGGSIGQTGYGFQLTYQGNTIPESISYCVDPTDAPPNNGAPYYIESSEASNETNYIKAAWLVKQVMNGSINPVAAQAAIWEIMFNGNGYTYTMTSDSNSDTPSYISNLVAQAENPNNYGNLNLTGYYIATSPTNSPASPFGVNYQDYLFYDGTPHFRVPEPSTIILLWAWLGGGC